MDLNSGIGASAIFWSLAAASAAVGFLAVLAPLWRAERAGAADAGGRQRGLALVLAVVATLASVGAYLRAGDPSALRAGGRDALASLTDPAAAGDRAALIARLDAHVARDPADLRAWTILARSRFAAGDYRAAADAFARVLADGSALAGDAALWCEYADALGMAQSGRLAGPPAEAVRRALAIDPAHPKALELAGGVALEAGDAARALEHWSRLLALLPAGSAQQRELLGAIERLEMRSGLMRRR
ncbi:MAG: hypothetical protein U1E86_10125 [Burkholderiaceae bacterium]